MKTRSNDIIPNAPFSYNSSTNTFEIGTNLHVNGRIITQDAIMLYDDTQITFYLDKENGEDITISPMFSYGEGITQLSFRYNLPDGAETYSAYLNLERTSNILTDKNTKKLFGNQSIFTEDGKGSIDLYRHQLKVKVGGSAVYFVITSSSNLKVTSLQDLTTVTKATNGYFTLAIRPGETNESVLVTYNNNKWGSSLGAITEITEDVVTTI